VTYDLDEVVKFDNKDMTLFSAARIIAGRPAVRRHPGLLIFREQGKQPGEFELADVERIMQTAEFKAALRQSEQRG
jgi:hypothetical protein